jgi:hypothetical protein
MNKSSKNGGVKDKSKTSEAPLKRRVFLKYSTAGLAASAFVIGACEDVTQAPANASNNGKGNNANARTSDHDTVYLGSGDTGILNYAYTWSSLKPHSTQRCAQKLLSVYVF